MTKSLQATEPKLVLASASRARAAMLSAAGHEVTLTPARPQAPVDADLIVADLDAESPQDLKGLGIPVLGYYSHVEVETRRAAEAAGIDLAVPRSRMARELPALVERLLA